MTLFGQYKLGNIILNNRLVMAPMTRSRAIDNIPNDLMVEYYRLRASAGLIITEGVAPSANGLGYPRIPGIYSQAQIEGWKKVTDAVHAEGGKIFIQLMHTGRVSHPENMGPNTRVLAPSAIGMSGGMWTDTKGKQAFPVPLEMTLRDIEQAQEEHVAASENAMEAGFDGVELHGANGYLIDQFINTASNKRQDEYGGHLKIVAGLHLKSQIKCLRRLVRNTQGFVFRLTEFITTWKYLRELKRLMSTWPVR